MRNRKALLAVAVAGALVLAACGDDSDSSDTTAPAGTEAPAATEPMAESTEPMAESTDAMSDAGTIVEVASQAGTFTTLLAAAEAAGLVETLQGEGPFTVFAPTDDAFAALPEGVLDKLLLPENQEILADILLYHVVQGAAVTSDQVQAGEVEMANGDAAQLSTDGGVKINDATVVTADIAASNGVIHVIDAVILPPGLDPSTL